MSEQLRELVREMRDRKFYDLFDYAPQVKEWIDRLESLLPAQPAAGEFDEDDGGIDYSYSPSQCVPASPKEEAAVDEALGLVRVVLRFPTLLHSTLTAEAESRGIAFPALIREKLTAKQPAAGEAVAWYVFADTEHWVTMEEDEAANSREQGFQVRPLVFGDMASATSPTANQADAEDGFKRNDRVIVRSHAGIEHAGTVTYKTGIQYSVFLDIGVGVTVDAAQVRSDPARAQSDDRSGGGV